MADVERREYRRLDIRLPLECRRRDGGEESSFRTVSLNVSTGGLYFEADMEDLQPGMLLDLELTVPPGDGHWPWHGRVSAVGEVIRVCTIDPGTEAGSRARRVGVAARFRERLKLSF